MFMLVFEGVDTVPKKDAIAKNGTHIMEPKRTKSLTTCVFWCVKHRGKLNSDFLEDPSDHKIPEVSFS